MGKAFPNILILTYSYHTDFICVFITNNCNKNFEVLIKKKSTKNTEIKFCCQFIGRLRLNYYFS